MGEVCHGQARSQITVDPRAVNFLLRAGENLLYLRIKARLPANNSHIRTEGIMVRGYQKRVIFLKNTGSKIFDEAYFVLSDDTSSQGVGEDSMIEEANRILADSSLISDGRRGRRILNALRRSLPAAVAFAVGIVLGGAGIILFSM